MLNRFAVIVRYPGITIKADTAEEALNAAKRVRKFIRSKLEIKIAGFFQCSSLKYGYRVNADPKGLKDL